MPKVRLGSRGHWESKAAAQRYADEKNKASRAYRYKVSRPSFYGRPGFEGASKHAGYTVVVSKRK